MVVSIFGDESSDESHERVFSVSGLVGTDAEWAEADALWMKATRGEEFRLTVFMPGSGPSGFLLQ